MHRADALKRLFRKHPLLVGAFTLSTLVAIVFAAKLITNVVYWKLHREEPLRSWMTVGYVGKSWDVKPSRIDEIAGFPPPDGKRRTLADIAREQNIPLDQVIGRAEAAIATIRAEKLEGTAP